MHRQEALKAGGHETINPFKQSIQGNLLIYCTGRPYIRIREDLEKPSCAIVLSAYVINCYVLLSNQQLRAMCCGDK